MKSVVSERGQMVIPKPLRKRLGFGPGQRVDCVEERGRLVVVKADPGVDPVDAVYGVLHLGRSTDDVIESLRGHRKRR